MLDIIHITIAKVTKPISICYVFSVGTTVSNVTDEEARNLQGMILLKDQLSYWHF